MICLSVRPVAALRALCACAVAVNGVSAARAGLTLADGSYRLHSHPNGALGTLPYGLRLDGLSGVRDEPFAFDFDQPGAAMLLHVDLAGGSHAGQPTLRIHGRAYGGHMSAGQFEDPTHGRVGLWEIDFSYRPRRASDVNGAGVLTKHYVADGFIRPLFGPTGTFDGRAIDLTDRPGTGAAGMLRLDLGHRGYDGISGWGRLAYRDGALSGTSNFLFAVEPEPEPVPVPGAVLLASVGLSLVGALRRRFGGA